MKKILVVDDSALMRSVMCDIINSDKGFQVEDRAVNGLEALNFLRRKKYDAVVLDINMPVMDGLQLLKELQKEKIHARVLIASTDSKAGARVTLDALDLGALEFIHKPGQAAACRVDEFRQNLIRLLKVVADGKPMTGTGAAKPQKQASKEPQKEPAKEPVKEAVKEAVEEVSEKPAPKPTEKVRKEKPADSVTVSSGKKVVAIASSTGGPKALQYVIPFLPKNLDAPVVIVQHMPQGFTASLAERLNGLSELEVAEAKEGEMLQPGHVYLSMGGKHMNVVRKEGGHCIHYSDEPSREGVKPCANYMYESLINSSYAEIICVVLTGMGADGTKGIQNLEPYKKLHVVAQNAESCAVYGMPKSIVKTGLVEKVLPLEQIAGEIISYTGVKKDGCKPIS